MELNCRKESINISENTLNLYSQAFVETDIIVPDYKADVERIIQTDVLASVVSKECVNGKLIVKGKLRFCILYIADNGDVASIMSVDDFEHTFNDTEIVDGMNVTLLSDVQNVEYEIINCRKLSVSTLVGLDARLSKNTPIDVLTDISGECAIETMCRTINPYSMVMNFEEDIAVSEKLEIPVGKPGIDSILKIDAKITNTEVRATNNKLIVKGIITVTTLYKGDLEDNAIQFVEHEEAFTEIIEADGVTDEMNIEVDFSVKDIDYRVEEDSDGDCRIIIVSVLVLAEIKSYCEQEKSIIEDLYSTDAYLDVKKESAVIDKVATCVNSQETLKATAILPTEFPEIMQICNVVAKPYISGTRAENGQIIVEGMIDTYILYLSEDLNCPIYTYKHQEPFTKQILSDETDCNMLCNAKIEVNHVSYTISMGREIELRYILDISAKVMCSVPVLYTKEVEATELLDEETANSCSVKIYFTKAGDKLWDIAKHYRTTAEKLAISNGVDADSELSAGKKIIII